ncbi:uncharacterized protein LOC127396190 isoform X2 [Apus apus]|uniref:uncharacterized protein LOC127396190 isoform X1 n=1 Tax=Apus apus TaxID=8895 RepID=UPI0021F8625C|nr:uncharacterized protein LOC127396190 isoform X1 [Apus apus]XP_051499762.1 uncharacterized protein LOC127396190 isoform X2 [Apus apus]
METPEATGATVPPEVSPELLKPLVTVVATLGELGATPGDVPLAGPLGSLRAGLVALVTNIRRAMDHPHGEATRLRRVLATAGATSAATPELEGSAVPRAATKDAWATAATVTREWLKVVAVVEDTWVRVAGDAEHLRDACRDAATAGATARATGDHLAVAVAQEKEARQELLMATRGLPITSELATMAEVVAAHRTQVANASTKLQEATKATEKAVVAMVEAQVAGARGRRAGLALEPLGRLVATCHAATYCYCHLRRRLEDIEATMAGRGGPEGTIGGPEITQEGPGVPTDLMAAVAAAEVLWEASGRLAKGHLLGTLRVARGLLAIPGVPDATAAARVAQQCHIATAAIPGLLSRGQQ